MIELKTRVTAPALVTFILLGCEQQEFRMPPYIVKEGCTFTLVISNTEQKSVTVGNGVDVTHYNLIVGKYPVAVSRCAILDNPNGLPVYED